MCQCLLRIAGIDGSLGSYSMAKTGRFDAFSLDTLFSGSDLGTLTILPSDILQEISRDFTEVYNHSQDCQ